jgi:cleavage and polyadenylation specificity factor subunit 1
MGAVLQQRAQGAWQTFAFFTRKFSPAQQKCGAYDRELLAIYEAVRYFHHMLEARHFTILTGDKPPSPSNKGGTSVRQGGSTNQFTTGIRHISGQDNIVADALSRFEAITAPVTHYALAAAQGHDDELRTQLVSNRVLQLENLLIPGTSVELYCDTYTAKPIPYAPSPLRRQVFDF